MFWVSKKTKFNSRHKKFLILVSQSEDVLDSEPGGPWAHCSTTPSLFHVTLTISFRSFTTRLVRYSKKCEGLTSPEGNFRCDVYGTNSEPLYFGVGKDEGKAKEVLPQTPSNHNVTIPFCGLWPLRLNQYNGVQGGRRTLGLLSSKPPLLYGLIVTFEITAL